jgi:glycosyltransferase involved in cell wall biosynthesis
MKPKVSVVMPVLNGERFIAEAIQSVADQTYKNCELVVVDRREPRAA